VRGRLDIPPFLLGIGIGRNHAVGIQRKGAKRQRRKVDTDETADGYGSLRSRNGDSHDWPFLGSKLLRLCAFAPLRLCVFALKFSA